MLLRTMLMLGGCCVYSAVAQEPQPSPIAPPATKVVKKSWQTIRKEEAFVPMTGGERAHFLLRRVVLSPGAPARAAFLAALDQRDNDPAAWGQGFDAYSRRFANRWARTAVRNTIESGAAAALGYEQRYIQCKCDGTMRRFGHAISMHFVTYNRHGHWVPNIPRVGSTIAAEYIGLSWLPPGERTARQATRGLALNLGVGGFANVWREFSPPLMRKLKSKLPGH